MIYSKKNTYRRIVFLWVLLFLLNTICLISCSNKIDNKTNWFTGKRKFDSDWIIGKTSAEIEERYGEFYICDENDKANGIYVDCSCAYLIKGSYTDMFTTVYTDECLFIYFDTEGIAYKTVERYLPGA